MINTQEEFRYNRRELTRNKIIFGDTLYKDEDYKASQYKYFTGLDAGQIQELCYHRFADPEEYHNDGPTIRQILLFLQKTPGFTASGYVIGKERSDYRVTLAELDSGDLSQVDDERFFELVTAILQSFDCQKADIELSRDRITLFWD